MIVRMLMLSHCLTKIHGRQQSENIGLENGHKQLQQTHGCREYGRSDSNKNTFEYKGESQKAQNNDVTCRNVGEQPDHQGKGLGNNPNQFDRKHNNSQQQWNTWCPENVGPVIFIAGKQCENECKKGETEGNRYVSGQVRSPWYKSQ